MGFANFEKIRLRQGELARGSPLAFGGAFILQKPLPAESLARITE